MDWRIIILYFCSSITINYIENVKIHVGMLKLRDLPIGMDMLHLFFFIFFFPLPRFCPIKFNLSGRVFSKAVLIVK